MSFMSCMSLILRQIASRLSRDTDVEVGKKGAVWQRCLEPLAIAQTAWPDDKEFQKEMAEVCLVRFCCLGLGETRNRVIWLGGKTGHHT